MMDLSLLQDFIVETAEHLEEMESGLLRLESEPHNRDILNDIFRDAHTIKGSAEYLGMEKIGELSHKLENLLEIIRHGDHTLDKEIINTLIESRDRIAALTKDLELHSSEQTEIGDLLERIDMLTRKAEHTEDTPQPPPQSTKRKDQPSLQNQTASVLEKPTETLHDIVLEEISEEEYDKELFSIFIQHLKENLTLLYKQVVDLPKSSSKTEVLKKCYGYVASLHSSANYMDYKQLNRLYELWSHEIEAAQTSLSEGKIVAFDFMNDYIQKIAGAFSKYELLDTSLAAVKEPEQEEELLPLDVSDLDISELSDISDFHEIEKVEEIPSSENQLLEVDSVELSEDGLMNEAVNMLETDHEKAKDAVEPELDVYQGLFEELDTAFEGVDDLEDISEQTDTADLLKELEEKIIASEKSDDLKTKEQEFETHLFEVPSVKESEIEEVGDIIDEGDSEIIELQETTAPEPDITDSDQIEPEQVQEVPVRPDHLPEKAAKQTLRVDARKIDALMNQVGELVVSRAWFSQLFNEMRSLQEYLHNAIKLDGKQMKPVKALTFRISEATVALGRVANELQESVMKVRMLPIAQLFNRYPRLIRDLTHGTDKKVDLEIIGEETELDKMVIEEISDPMIHILRNAVDHGCERIEERKKAGKPEVCRIRLESYHESNHVVIEVSDDGRGINPELIKAAALKKKIHTKEELARMSFRDILGIIMKPGFSTATQVSKTSGRGVGMDVVKQNVEKLNGTIELDSKVGEGTRIRIKIPLTLAIIQALLVRVGKDIFTIPLAAVEETLRITEKDITTIEGVDVIHLRDSTLSLLRLSDIFNIVSKPVAPNKYFVVVVNTGIYRAGFVVDALIGQEETVIKPLVDYLQENSGFSGATILGDGRISLILDIYQLVNMAISRRISKAVPYKYKHPSLHEIPAAA